MQWLDDWWRAEILDGSKGPLLLSFVAFVATFAVTRTITRLIRAGKGPFHDVSSGGVHVHHSTPGIILLVTGGFGAVAAQYLSLWAYLAALFVGVGSSLVLDEFAMIFHLQDDYWTQEGQLSVSVVSLAAACIGLAVVGLSPVGVVDIGTTERHVRSGLTAALLVHCAFVVITALKGKYPSALIGLFLSPVTMVAAIRLARPTSPWARWFYSHRRIDRARQRAARFDHRWQPIGRHWDDLVGGTPTPTETESSRASE